MDELKVTVAGLDFFGDKGPFLIEPGGFNGWGDGVAMRLDEIQREAAHGSFDLPGLQDSRTIGLSGNVFADSSQQLAVLGDRFTGLLAGGQSGRVQVSRPWGTRWANCRLAAQSKFVERGGTPTATFQLQLWCPDPRKFGETKSFPLAAGSPATVFHWGNFEALPVVRVVGPLAAGFTVSGAGKSYTYTGGIGSGETYILDFNTGLLTVNGTDRTHLVTSADTWPVPPGQQVVFSLSNGAGSVTILDTYI